MPRAPIVSRPGRLAGVPALALAVLGGACTPSPVTGAGPGRVQGYELSEVDGSIVSLTDYPVLLNP